jgi:hypothetical protein
MVQDSGALSGNIQSFYKLHQTQDTLPTLEEFTRALELEIALYSKVFIILDGLDECPEDNGTRGSLLGVLQSLAGTVNLMVTSRDISSIARHFSGTQHLDICANDHDLRTYIGCRIASLPRQHLVELQETIVKTIVENACGM